MSEQIRNQSLHILQHALGLDDFGRGKSYRSHFVTGPGSDNWALCMEHFEAGRMTRRGPHALYGDSYCFSVTDAGREYVRENSQKPPKRTRSQQRYEQFLREDSNMKFGEWLKERSGRGMEG